MEILLWLVPSVVVTAMAMAWVSWTGHLEGRQPREADRQADVERMARALAKEQRTRRIPRQERPADRSTGIAVRPTRRAS